MYYIINVFTLCIYTSNAFIPFTYTMNVFIQCKYIYTMYSYYLCMNVFILCIHTMNVFKLLMHECIHTTHGWMYSQYVHIPYTIHMLLIVQVLSTKCPKDFAVVVRIGIASIAGEWEQGRRGRRRRTLRMTVNGDAKIVFRPSGHLSVRY